MAVRSGQDPGSPEMGWETLCAVVSFGTMWQERRVGMWTKIKTNYTSLHFTTSVLPATRDFPSIQMRTSAQIPNQSRLFG